MSYDIWVEIPCKDESGNESWSGIGISHNYTFNVSKMLYEAFEKTGGDWGSFCNYKKPKKKCKDAIRELENAIYELKHNYEYYSTMNPKNGWGNIEGAIAFLEKILFDCKKFDQGRINFWV
jgi:hypothetical protein